MSQHLTDEEIADSMLIPADLTEEEQEEANRKLKAFRLKLLSERTEAQRLYSDLLRFRYQLEECIDHQGYDEKMNVGVQVEEYGRILKKTKKQLSQELNDHYTKLSRIINNRESPNVEFMYRLEEHSGGLVPAIVWWKLLIKKQEHEIVMDQKTREMIASQVKRAVVG